MLNKIEYNPTKHLKLEEALEMGIPPEILTYIPSYKLNGTKFIDRLEIGRTIYNPNVKNNYANEGLGIERYFTKEKDDPFKSVGEYEQRRIEIRDYKGNFIFTLDGEFPKSWNEVSSKVAASKYFFRPNEEEWGRNIEEIIGKPYEYSPIHLFSRVSTFFGEWGQKLGYFKTNEEREIFEDELKFLQINQMGAFNSPVYFNAGLYSKYSIAGSPGLNFVRDYETGKVTKVEEGCYIRPQCHACFIIGPEDNLESILNHGVTEGGIFTNGSGVGHNLELRAEGESLSSGGKSSGPMSFFGFYDHLASTIKSGGKTRRAARMTTMRYHHPDIMKFIRGKVREDYKALLLMKAGLEPGFEGEAYTSVKFQNTNLSVRLDDHFFEQLERGGEVELRYIKNHKVAEKISADQMLKEIAFGSWRIGDPAVQYESKIQEYHTCKNSGLINSSNPCSEYMFLDNTSCNLASLNLLKFADKKGNINIERYRKAAAIFTIAQDIANYAGSYPNPKIAAVSPEFGTIGLGYANLGSLVMRRGFAYDSDEGRDLAASLTAILTGESYLTSSKIAKSLGTFVHYEFNKKPMMEVMERHKENLDNIKWDKLEVTLKESAYEVWEKVIENGNKHGFRNAQATVLAPTGTIGLLMGCDTTGVEPATGLKITKNLAGGGSLKLVNGEISNALNNLNYNDKEISDILDYIDKNSEAAGAPHLNPDHYTIFDTAFSPNKNGRSIPFQGHIKMLGAVQPFVSGAISKTNNLPETATVKDIYDGYILGHKLGLKAVSVFRYYSKPVSVLSFGEKNIYKELKRGEKREPPQLRFGPKIEVEIGGMTHHINIGEYEDGTVAEIFVNAGKAGSTLTGLYDSFSIGVSTALKTGTDLEKLVEKFVGREFEPKGFTNHPYIRNAKSPFDFAFRWIAVEYLGKTEYADDQTKIDISKLRGIQNGATRIYQRKIDDWNYKQVINDSELGGFSTVLNNNQEITKLVNKHGNNGKKSSGIPCRACGNMMDVVKANCYECSNCHEKVGGCG